MTSGLTVIAMLASKVALAALAIVAAKFVTKRMKIKKADRFLMKIHRQTAYVLVASVLTHAVLSLFAFAVAPVAVYIAGFACLLAMAVAIRTFAARKTIGSKWQHFHRAAAALAIIALALHLILRS